ncbi:hypothetical protein PHSY_004499 [Pseudozyma hubeiensis SY62]|uniref:Uncharacterized protein n=1 Tax=Pseudozyma hubeiensis (strain SY62) TaxID=1305764 RepID=R9PFR4_PSEHS|nr:hypothetical protein PHSY_004499 [Pseudozyma hubeiensis SY62]GAC96915.1 hypothetical protein PHSY_004499 [Pseudozyma hubeiensis SY62]
MVSTRSSMRRHSASAPARASTSKSNDAQSLTHQPGRTRQGKRRQSSSDQHDITKRDGTSDAHPSRHSTHSIGSGRADLTWQQRELLHQQRSKSRSRQNSKAALSSSNLPTLRVTSDCQIVLAAESEAPEMSHERNRVPLNQRSLQRPRSDQPDPSKAKRHRTSGRLNTLRSTSATPEAYAEPSCFRAPVPQALPMPFFSKSTKSVAVA